MNGADPARFPRRFVDESADETERIGRLREALARAVARACPAWMSADRDDLVQATMLKVLAVERPPEEKAELPSSYLQRVALNAVIDEIRARRRRGEISLDEEEMKQSQESRLPDPDSAARGREIGRGVRGCLAAMKEERRVALTLRLLGHSVPEAARLLGWANKRTENLIYRGLANLRACLAAKGLKP